MIAFGFGSLIETRVLDVPLMVEWEDGRREILLFALEEESDSHRFSVHRLTRYCVDLAELFETDRVVPVVIFLRLADHVHPGLRPGSERRDYLVFDYIACELAAMPFEQWENSNNVVARIMLMNMQWQAQTKIRAYARAIRGLLELEPDLRKRAKYIDFIDIYAALTDNERRRYERDYPEEQEDMAGIVQRAREEGMEQGIQRGERAVLERLLQRRFGQLPTELHQKLEQASSEDLEHWVDQVFDAETLDDIFK